jgi:signal peptidase I
MEGNTGKSLKPPADLRVGFYRSVKFFIFLAAAALAVKFFLFDTVVIKTGQMSPALTAGDRVLLVRAPFIPVLNKIFTPAIGSPVVASHPTAPGSYICLRVAGLAGDSVAISKGMLTIANKPGVRLGFGLPDAEVLPLVYSPRDTMATYRIPASGDTLELDSLPLRDFFFAAALIKQENAKKNLRVRPLLFIDGKQTPGFSLADFSLYKGALDSIASRFDFDWFFWDRLREYLARALKGKDFRLDFGLFDGSARMSEYCVKKSCIFLLADDWRKGFDSRYFGPVPLESVRGKPLCVLWSWASGEEGKIGLRMERMIKLVR